MLKSKLFSACLLVAAASAGCSLAPLTKRVDMLEKEFDDQRASNQRLEQRLDEMQIQLALIKNRLHSSTGHSSTEPGPDLPRLGVVKLKSGQGPVPGSIKRKKRHPWKLHQIKVKPVDPSTVTERLSVDREAANRPLYREGIHVEEGHGDAADSEGGSGNDEDSVGLRMFNEAFSLYRANQFAKAADALEEFSNRYPDHEMSPSGLYYAAKARMMIGQFKDAASIFKRLVKLYPTDERNAKALLMAGRCEERLGRAGDARGTYMELVDAFPLSQEAVTANKRLKSIR